MDAGYGGRERAEKGAELRSGRIGRWLLSLLFGMPGAAIAASAPPVGATYPPYAGNPDGQSQTVSVSVSTGSGGLRSFAFTSTAPQRDNGPNRRTVAETVDQPRLRTGGAWFDALFALAIDDARLDSVETIRDDSYNGGRPIPCHCFQTGEKWPFVWTRDLAYALDLGLAGLDPARGEASLIFKTSGFRPGVAPPPELPGGTTQIVQDTGSGGSWPVSTDRTVWALGAESVLAEMAGPDRAAFATRAFAALSGTIEADRIAAYDPLDGLYRGEQSFLDWREQSYAAWIPDHLSALAESKALSTNIVQYRAQRLAAELAREAGADALADRYDGWADALKHAIDKVFWDDSAGLYATYTGSALNAGPLAKYDALGNALAVVSGIADRGRAREIAAHYPFAPFGPPVVWPEAANVDIYHNRAIWPFVTGYMLRAAAEARNVTAADRALDSLMRGAALNLSNMENLEWLTGTATYEGGPVLDSRRQLWSVGAYYGAVVHSLFGWQPGIEGVRIAPFLTTATRALMGDADTARLTGLRYQGKPVDILLHLPPKAPPGEVYRVGRITLNGVVVHGRFPAAFRSDANLVEVSFGKPELGEDAISEVPLVPAASHDDPRVFLPSTPTIARAVASATGVSVAIIAGAPPPANARYRVLRDGRVAADGIAAGIWADPDPPAPTQTACYQAIAIDPATGFHSQPSLPACVRGSLAQDIAITDPRVTADRGVLPAGGGVAEPTIPLALGTRLFVRDVAIARGGTYAVTLRYDNHLFAANTGVTNAVKRLALVDAQGRRQEAILQMPEIFPEGDDHPIRLSTRALFRLEPGIYRIEMSDFFNMSALAANADYAGAGGTGGPVNEARIATIRIDSVDARD